MKKVTLIGILLISTSLGSAQNLIPNSSFEAGGQLLCADWYDNCDQEMTFLCDSILPDTTCDAIFVQDAPPGGGNWSVEVPALGQMSLRVATTYITGQSGTNIYELKAWIKEMATGLGAVRTQKISQGQTELISILPDSNFGGFTDWTLYTGYDTITTLASDTIEISVIAGGPGPSSGNVRFDMIELSIIDSITTAQCFANAGNDAVVCGDLSGGDTVNLGGNPTAVGGTPPYTYIWETSYTYLSTVLTASDFLVDTTVANPEAISSGFTDQLFFNLTVVDSSGNTCTDTVKVQYSQFCVTLEDKMALINQGDTIQLHSSVGCGISPLTYSWTPNYNLSDPNIQNPFAYPDSSIDYVVSIVDSTGCPITDPDAYEVFVTPVGIENQSKDQLRLKVFPNPFGTSTTIYLVNRLEGEYALSLYNSVGQVVKRIDHIDENKITITRDELSSGLYYFNLNNQNGKVTQGTILIE